MPGSQVISFAFVQPRLLARTKKIDVATVLTVYGLVQGQMVDLISFDSRMQSRVINHNLIDLARSLYARDQLVKQSTEGSIMPFYYCAACGRALASTGCKTCGVELRLSQRDQALLVGTTPIIPARVVRYAVEVCRLEFSRQPPRA